MTIHTKPKRLPGDNPLLRDAWLRDRDSLLDYSQWLRDHGIDPETGKMTDDGLAFFRSLLGKQMRAAG